MHRIQQEIGQMTSTFRERISSNDEEKNRHFLDRILYRNGIDPREFHVESIDSWRDLKKGRELSGHFHILPSAKLRVGRYSVVFSSAADVPFTIDKDGALSLGGDALAIPVTLSRDIPRGEGREELNILVNKIDLGEGGKSSGRFFLARGCYNGMPLQEVIKIGGKSGSVVIEEGDEAEYGEPTSLGTYGDRLRRKDNVGTRLPRSPFRGVASYFNVEIPDSFKNVEDVRGEVTEGTEFVVPDITDVSGTSPVDVETGVYDTAKKKMQFRVKVVGEVASQLHNDVAKGEVSLNLWGKEDNLEVTVNDDKGESHTLRCDSITYRFVPGEKGLEFRQLLMVPSGRNESVVVTKGGDFLLPGEDWSYHFVGGHGRSPREHKPMQSAVAWIKEKISQE